MLIERFVIASQKPDRIRRSSSDPTRLPRAGIRWLSATDVCGLPRSSPSQCGQSFASSRTTTSFWPKVRKTALGKSAVH